MKHRITIVRNSESLPSDLSGARLWRSGLFAKYFFDKGYSVSWLISSFDHYNKRNRNRNKATPFDGEPGLHETVTLIKTYGYTKNLSLSRFFDHFLFGIKVFFELRRSVKPDCVICSYPTPDSSFACVLYGLLHKVPIILDIRDKWPDVLIEAQRGKSTIVDQIVLSPYTFMKVISLRYATSLIAANPSFLEWGQGYAKKGSKDLGLVSYIPFEIPSLSDEHHSKASEILNSLQCDKDDIIISFAGTIGKMFEFESLFGALEKADKSNIKVKVIICGRGSELEGLRFKFRNFKNVMFTGQIESQVVFALLKLSDVLLAPYRKLDNFHGHLPNKFMEYCASGKPILSSLTGLPAELIKKHSLGQNFNDAKTLFESIKYYQSNSNALLKHSSNAADIYENVYHPKVLLPQLEKKVLQIIHDSKTSNQ